MSNAEALQEFERLVLRIATDDGISLEQARIRARRAYPSLAGKALRATIQTVEVKS